MCFVDANVFLRFLTRDDPVKAERVKDLLIRAHQGQVRLITTEAVIVELVFILASPRLYKLPRPQVRKLLIPLLTVPGLRLPHRAVYLRALDLYAASTMDFVDAVMVAHMERRGVRQIYSYDKHFNLVPGLRRIEP